MEIKINDTISLTEYRKSDKAALLKYLNDEDIYKNTLSIPHPYIEASADFWLNMVFEKYAKIGNKTELVIRDSQGEQIGGIGRLILSGLDSHTDEIGYWLAKPFWNKGIMTQVVSKFTEFCFEEFPLVRITAKVFIHNIGSSRVLEKAGFQKEGHLRKAYLKDGELLDAILYSKIKEGKCLDINKFHI